MRIDRELAERPAVPHDRDLAPASILLTADGGLRLIDADRTPDELGHIDRSAPVFQASQRPSRELLPASDDIYALGATLYFLATGADPDCGPGPGALPRRPIQLLNPEIGPALIAVIDRCLAADAMDRFQRLTDLATALREAARADRRHVALVTFPVAVMKSRRVTTLGHGRGVWVTRSVRRAWTKPMAAGAAGSS